MEIGAPLAVVSESRVEEDHHVIILKPHSRVSLMTLSIHGDADQCNTRTSEITSLVLKPSEVVCILKKKEKKKKQKTAIQYLMYVRNKVLFIGTFI